MAFGLYLTFAAFLFVFTLMTLMGGYYRDFFIFFFTLVLLLCGMFILKSATVFSTIKNTEYMYSILNDGNFTLGISNGIVGMIKENGNMHMQKIPQDTKIVYTNSSIAILQTEQKVNINTKWFFMNQLDDKDPTVVLYIPKNTKFSLTSYHE